MGGGSLQVLQSVLHEVQLLVSLFSCRQVVIPRKAVTVKRPQSPVQEIAYRRIALLFQQAGEDRPLPVRAAGFVRRRPRKCSGNYNPAARVTAAQLK